MSTTNPPPGVSSPTLPGSTGQMRTRPKEIKLVSHSPIFYWWPIWFLGYVMALMTLVENHRLAILPPNTKITADHSDDAKLKGYTLKTDGTTTNLEKAYKDQEAGHDVFKARVSQRAWMGPLYCIILILTILITNIPLRGLWSFLVILLLVVVALGITLVPGGWDDLLAAFGGLHIYINMAGYLFIATTVFILWVVSVFIFDQRTYMIVTPGSVQVCEHIGASVRNFDTTGMTFEKQRDDLFRHWILGFFSGDLIVHTSGATPVEIRLPNVLWIGWRLQEVQEILREKQVVTSNK